LTIKIPSGTNSGETLEIRKRGLPGRRSGGRGDIIVLVKLHMPKKVNKKTKKALQEVKDALAPSDMIERIKQDAKERRS
jgi:molecular chaperone DnaJ